MELNKISIFHLLSQIELALKNYNEKHSDINQILQISEILKTAKLSPEIIFQQLIPGKSQFFSLKMTLFKELSSLFPNNQPNGLDIESLEKIESVSNLTSNVDIASEIIRKISALKSEIIFVNQQLTIQILDTKIDEKTKKYLERISLRKLIKQYIRRTKNRTQISSLSSICIRLVVIQQAIMFELGKSLSFCLGISDNSDQIEAKVIDLKKGSNSISSLSTSIQKYLERQNEETQDEDSVKQLMVKEYGIHSPKIRSNFILQRKNNRCLVELGKTRQQDKCCLWF